MTTTLWLRISSVVSLPFAAGHTLGGLKYWSPMGDNTVLQGMRTVRFDTMGANRSYFDFYMGFGYSLSVALMMQAILLWQLATLARTVARRYDARTKRPVWRNLRDLVDRRLMADGAQMRTASERPNLRFGAVARFRLN